VRKFAWLITRIFDPTIEIPLAVGMTVWFAVEPSLRLMMLLFIGVFYVLLPAIYFVVRIRKGKVSDWDVTKREERRAIYQFSIVSHLVGVLAVASLEQFFLMKILLILWIVSVVFMVINMYWKISVHAGVNAFLMVLLNNFYGWKIFGWLMVVLLLVLWSRVYLRKHTTTQVMAGAIIAFVLVELGMRMVGI